MKTSFAMDIATNLRQQLVTMFREIGNEKKAAENLADCCLGLNNDHYIDADVCDIRQFLLPIWLDEVADVPIDDDVPETEWERDTTVQGDLDQEILNAHEKSAPGEIIRGKRKREAMDDDALSDLLEDVGDVVCENPATPRDAIGRDLLDLEPGELDDLIRDCREHGGPSQPKRARVRADGFDDPGDPDYYRFFGITEDRIKKSPQHWISVVRILHYVNKRLIEVSDHPDFKPLCPQPSNESVGFFRFDQYCLQNIGAWKGTWELTAPGGACKFLDPQRKAEADASFLTDGVSSRLTYEVVGPKVAKSEQDPRHLVKPHLQRLAETHPSVLPVWALDPGDTDVFSAFLWGTEKRVLAHWTLSGGYWRRKCGQIYAQKNHPQVGLRLEINKDEVCWRFGRLLHDKPWRNYEQ
eukprot:CAMPEP_0185856742 /NCGR_PEP_ID=MMETSP1354-20130828/29155_1 /TAXON_ID=708628 /ORGANISM="Erythrolobus madagascarensis, Strain CCMP3276" /LENGTH=410 /DNA_ID=CAMNT_0028559003 /DNA_START=323 /DNA_END=1557 /DNA_ORIENTATION=-